MCGKIHYNVQPINHSSAFLLLFFWLIWSFNLYSVCSYRIGMMNDTQVFRGPFTISAISWLKLTFFFPPTQNIFFCISWSLFFVVHTEWSDLCRCCCYFRGHLLLFIWIQCQWERDNWGIVEINLMKSNRVLVWL